MARSLRIEFPGAFYHVMARGNLRGDIFLDDDDRRFFLQALGQACARTGWKVHAWVLMNNHYHLFIQTPEANLVDGMRWLQNTVTRRYNVRHRKWGRVFGDRYKSVVIEGEQTGYYETLWDYIHLNPVRAGIIKPAERQSVMDYPWSSLAGGYGLAQKKRALWLAATEGLAAMGVPDTIAGRRSLVERLNRRSLEEGLRSGVVPLPEEVDARLSHLRRGWYWGRQEFGERLLKLAPKSMFEAKSRAYARSREKQAHGMEQAEKWLIKGLAICGLDADDLEKIPGSDPRKVILAKLAWENTTVSQEWIAQKLGMASAANVSQILRRNGWEVLKKAAPANLVKFVKNETS